MSFSLRNAVVGFLLLAAAIATWLVGRTGFGTDPRFEPAGPARPGYYLRDAVLLGTGEDGRVIYRIHAGRAEEDPEARSLALVSVRVEYRDSQDVEWQVSAERATAPTDGSYLELAGGVRLTSGSGEGAEPTVVETERLRLEPRRAIATSDAPVSLSAAGLSLSARGLEADLKQDTLELEADVRGHFSP